MALWQTILALGIGILVIVLLTGRYRVPAFFALLLAAIVTATALWLPAGTALKAIKSGFGNTLQSLGWIVVLGTTLGLLLEANGSTRVMADFLLRLFGKKRASLSVASTGFVVGLPVFCDAGFVILSGLNPAIARRSSVPLLTLSVALASGLYVVHCLLPPHPGAAAAASALGADYGKVTGYGILVAIPSMFIAHAWARYCGRKATAAPPEAIQDRQEEPAIASSPSVWMAFIPVMVPLMLIATRSILMNKAAFQSGPASEWLEMGDPAIALLTGLVICLLSSARMLTRDSVMSILEKAVEKAGPILLVTGAGGAFGAVLAIAGIDEQIAGISGTESLGLLLPFGIAFLLKTAQGSSTVAIITTASIIAPLLPLLGLDSENGRILTTLAMGAGSMMVSHANDSYFWVIARISGIDTKTMLRTYTVATVILALTSFAFIALLSLLISS